MIMSNERLEAHYEAKYAYDGSSSIGLIPKVRIPRTRFEAVVSFFPFIFKGGKILELGAGNGIVAKSLLKSDLSISNYTVSEISKPRLEGLRKNVIDKRLSIINLNAENLPENIDVKYDAIIMIALIEHLIDPMGAMKKIRRLLNPGGFVYIDTPNIAKYTRRIKLLFGKFPSTSSRNEGLTTYSNQPVDLYDEGHLHYFTYRSLSLMLTERCGYSRVVKLGYPDGRTLIQDKVNNYLATRWPEMFSELVVLVYR